MVQMTEAGRKRASVFTPEPLSEEASLDRAEELFVSCRFTEAARVCNDALNYDLNTSSSARSSDESARMRPVVAFDDQLVAPTQDCETLDLIVAVLLQCGFELRRMEEWDRCRAFYARRGAMPFAVSTLWLRLRLAGGEHDLVRRVLLQLRATLGEELRATASPSNPGESNSAAHDNYLEAMEMLVVHIMLPSREFTEASALVSNDPFLEQREKSQLLKSCELSAGHTREHESSAEGGGGGARRPLENGSYSRRGAGRAAGGPQDRYGTSLHSEPPPISARNGQQGPVQKFFSDVSDWTPEVRLQLVVGAGAAGLAAYAACRNRDSLWRAARGAAGLASRTVGDIGTFIIGSS